MPQQHHRKNGQSSHPTPTLSTPGDLIANLPGILGFYPAESIVFTAMFQDGDQSRYTLGPVLRIDIDELNLLPDVGKAIKAVNADLIFAFAITEESTGSGIEPIVEKLFEVAEDKVIDISACWVTTGVYSGEAYQLAFGPPPESLLNGIHGLKDWENGRISPVAQAVSTQKMLEAGHLPEVSRGEAYGVFHSGNPYLSPNTLVELTRDATLFGKEIVDAIEDDCDGGTFQAALEHFEQIAGRAGTLNDSHGSMQLMQQPDLLKNAAAYVSQTLLRDAIIHHCASSPHQTSNLFLAIARTFDGEIRSNALCMYALASIALDLGMKAVPALDAAIASSPTHNLSHLIRQGLMEGQYSTMIDAVLRGNYALREQYLSAEQNVFEHEKGSDSEKDESEPAEAA